MSFKIDWASPINGRKFTVFALFYFVFEGNFQVKAPPGGLYLEGLFNGGFIVTSLGALYLEGLNMSLWTRINKSSHGLCFFARR